MHCEVCVLESTRHSFKFLLYEAGYLTSDVTFQGIVLWGGGVHVCETQGSKEAAEDDPPQILGKQKQCRKVRESASLMLLLSPQTFSSLFLCKDTGKINDFTIDGLRKVGKEIDTGALFPPPMG